MAKRKKVLVISYYWPPAGGPGVQRVLKFCKYLPLCGWEPIVLTVADGEYPAVDESLLQDVPPGLRIIRTSSFEPYALYRRLTGKKPDEKIATFVLTEDTQGTLLQRLAAFIRGNIFIPDARIGWLPFAVKAGAQIIRAQGVDLLFSSGPPMTAHLIARVLSKQTGRPWVADFRDPWTDVFYYHTLHRTCAALQLDRRLERSVLSSASAVVTVSPTLKNLFQKKAENDYFVIPNGFDEEDFIPAPRDVVRRFVHAGHLAVNQNPVALWRAFRRIIEESREPTVVEFYGSVHSEVRRSLAEEGLLPHCRFHGYLPHRQAAAAMVSAALLFFVIPETSYAKGIPTSKLFDYLGAGRPILGIGPPDGDAAEYLRAAQAGIVLAPDDPEMTEKIIDLLSRQPGENRFLFSRRRQTVELAKLFDQLLTKA
ncbi:MAG: glycosyltransferase family 4 protein [candidate division KSB1 bacterium]|nr:glycosyltransferase family 4 protein [candidate division KSB1 bacterium]